MTSAWAFAVAAWARPEVAAICLDLQNAHGQLPALLLWRWWCLVENRAVGREELAKAVEMARDWESEALRPLRALRQRLGAPAASVGDAARAAVRRRVVETELAAEHALIDALEALQAPGPGGAGTRLEAMLDLAEAWRPPAPSAALARLVEAL